MKINRLTISELRGIRELTLPLDSRSAVIWGPNGVGKSGIIDACDFLLGGQVGRLTGTGAGQLSLRRHGPHVRSVKGSSAVAANVTLKSGAIADIERRVSEPDRLLGDAAAESECSEISSKGQHVLTRREILNFITVIPSTRAQGINELLDLEQIETTRTELVTLRNSAASESEQSQSQAEQEQERLAALAQVDRNEEGALLAAINQLRLELSLTALANLSDAEVISGLEAPDPNAADAARRANIRSDLKRLTEFLDEETFVNDSQAQIDAVVSSMDELRDIDGFRRLLQLSDLVTSGLALLNTTGACPLCDAPWEPAELRAHIAAKHASVQVAMTLKAQMDKAVKDLATGSLQQLSARVSVAREVCARDGLIDADHPLSAWGDQLAVTIAALSDPLEFLREENRVDLRAALAPPTDFGEGIQTVMAKLPAGGESTTRDRARDRLPRIDQQFKNSRDASAQAAASSERSRVAQLIHDAFLASRDEVLKELFDSVRDRFVEFYRVLHPEEGAAFEASLGPTARGAGLDFSVDFYGAGSFPPHALHSEGHQDSMGLCLFLALAEKLAGGQNPDILLLDDVIMSVDRDHRKQVARLLKEYFSETQFIITTHDRAWAKHLVAAGVVRSSDVWEFRNWDVETGPTIGKPVQVWERIERQLAEADVRGAAHTLRSHLEEMLLEVCGNLRAEVRLRPDGQYEAGDLGDPAFEELKKTIRAGLRRAGEVGDDERAKTLTRLEERRQAARRELKIDEWTISANVHFNELLELSPNEFRDVAAGYRTGLEIFNCSACEQALELTYGADARPTAVTCRQCGQTGWPV